MSTERRLKITRGIAAQGVLLSTTRTRQYTKEQTDRAMEYERLRVYVGFTARDEGRSRMRLAEFGDPEDAALYVDSHNTANEVDMLPSELLAKLREAVELLERSAKTLERTANDTLDGRNTAIDVRDFLSTLNLKP